MNKFAEVLFGKIANIYDTTRTLEEFKKLFVPATLIIDVSKVKDVGLGYRVDFKSDTDFEIIPPKKIIPPTQEEQDILEANNKRSQLRELAIQAMMTTLAGTELKTAQTEYKAELDKIPSNIALHLTDLFPLWSADSVEYKKGNRVVYKGVLYEVIQNHTSQSTWTPDTAVSLFTKVISSIAGEIPEWQQPSSTNPYKKGDRVKFKGKIYESTINNNVWSPETYPDGWKDVTDEVNK